MCIYWWNKLRPNCIAVAHKAWRQNGIGNCQHIHNALIHLISLERIISSGKDNLCPNLQCKTPDLSLNVLSMQSRNNIWLKADYACVHPEYFTTRIYLLTIWLLSYMCLKKVISELLAGKVAPWKKKDSNIKLALSSKWRHCIWKWWNWNAWFYFSFTSQKKVWKNSADSVLVIST